ncbi:MAG: DUF4418 family protein [Candidatus Methanoplasma sp.]|jgi:hypothetical protein|nr:DUF4418 family protein [Candidatus Methanoplasma sp.]
MGKIRIVLGIVITILGILIAIGPAYISAFSVCSAIHAGDACHWTARAEIGVGAAIALLGILSLVIRSDGIRTGLGISILINSTLALLIPTVLIPVSDMASMTCRTHALPALTAVSLVLIVLSLVYLYSINKGSEPGAS